MLQDRPGECIIKNEFTAAAVDYLNQFPMFKEEKQCYIIRDSIIIVLDLISSNAIYLLSI
jgi:hypothetical protein